MYVTHNQFLAARAALPINHYIRRDDPERVILYHGVAAWHAAAICFAYVDRFISRVFVLGYFPSETNLDKCHMDRFYYADFGLLLNCAGPYA